VPVTVVALSAHPTAGNTQVILMMFTRRTMDLTSVDLIRVAHDRADVTIGPGVVPLAGGTWLFSEPQPHVRELVDLTALGWAPATADADGLTISATCTIRELADLPPLAGWRSQHLVEACARSLVASVKIWDSATVGGNICLALPAGALISLTTALDATAIIWTPDGGERRLPVADLVTGVRTTALGDGELLRALHVRTTALRGTAVFRRAALTRHGRSGTVVIGRVDEDGTLVVTVTAGVPRPRQLRFDTLPDADCLRAAIEAIGEWYDDPHGSPDWRHAMTARLAEQVRQELTGVATGQVGGGAA